MRLETAQAVGGRRQFELYTFQKNFFRDARCCVQRGWKPLLRRFAYGL